MISLSPPEHEHNAAVEQAAMWLSEQAPGSVKPTVPVLQQRFGVTIHEACEVISLAGRMRMLRMAAS